MDLKLAIAIAAIGSGATALIDLWALLRQRLFRQPPPDWGLVGRWVAYLARGKLRHVAIAATPPVRHEMLIGWSAHYLIGIALAAALPALWGTAWIRDPMLFPALAWGLMSTAAPFLILQPAMGAGIAGRRTRSPVATRVHSLATHTVFGLGLYLTASLVRLWP